MVGPDLRQLICRVTMVERRRGNVTASLRKVDEGPRSRLAVVPARHHGLHLLVAGVAAGKGYTPGASEQQRLGARHASPIGIGVGSQPGAKTCHTREQVSSNTSRHRRKEGHQEPLNDRRKRRRGVDRNDVHKR